MVHFVKGNLFDYNAEALVNTVNTVGIMGKGIALKFRERFPLNYKLYAAACKKGEVTIGKMFTTPTNSLMNPKWIINFPTKKHWMHKSSYAYIDEGLDDLIDQIHRLSIHSIAIPPLGTGHGGLDWDRIKQLLTKKLNNLKDVDITVFEPTLVASDQTAPSAKASLTKPRALILALVQGYRKLGFDTSLLEIQKLAYFLQRMGQKDLHLSYKKYWYGPYAHNLQHLLHELENGYLLSEKSVMDSKPHDLVHLNIEVMDEVNKYIEDHCSSDEKFRLERVLRLMSGYESPFGLELLASVDWILQANNTETLTAEIVKKKLGSWSPRKDQTFSISHVNSAMNRLTELSVDAP